MSTPTYLISTRSFGILRKAADNIGEARVWAARALGPEVRFVQREIAGTSIDALEAAEREWDRMMRGGRSR